MIKYFLYRFIVFIEIAALGLIFNLDAIPFVTVVFEDYRGEGINKLIGSLLGGLTIIIIVYLLAFLFICTTWVLINEYHNKYSLKELILFIKPHLLADQLVNCINHLYRREKHQILLIGIIILIILPVQIPYLGHYKTYGTLDGFSSEADELIENYFPDSYNLSKYEHAIVVERGSATEKIVDYIFSKAGDGKEINKYFFTNSAARIRGYKHYEGSSIHECISYDDIFLMSDWIIAYFLSFWDAIMRALIYGLTPYIIGTIILNKKQIDDYYGIHS